MASISAWRAGRTAASRWRARIANRANTVRRCRFAKSSRTKSPAAILATTQPAAPVAASTLSPSSAHAKSALIQGWAKPPGPAFGRPDDRLRVPTKGRGLVGTGRASARLCRSYGRGAPQRICGAPPRPTPVTYRSARPYGCTALLRLQVLPELAEQQFLIAGGDRL